MQRQPPESPRLSRDLKECCCTPCTTLKAAEARLEQLKAAVLATEAEVLQIRHTVNDVHDPLAQVPREIVSVIFEKIYDDYQANVTYPPFKLGAVCRSWRDIAWSTPMIWNSVHFTLDPDHETENCVELLKQYVGRSGILRLSIHLEWCHAEGYIFEEEAFEPIIEVLKPCISRWDSVHLELPVFAYSRLVEDVQQGSHSTLRHLTLQPTDTDWLFLDYPPIYGWTYITANLKTLTLLVNDQSFEGYLDLDYIRVNPSNLTQLSGSVSCSGWFHFLQTSPLLTSATIKLLPDFAGYNYPVYNHCSHTSLTNLSIVSPSPDDLNELLYRTTCSKLEILSVDSLEPSATPSIESMHSFLSRSGQFLHALELFQFSWSSAELQRCLESIPRLEELSFYHPRNMTVYQIMEIVFGEFAGVNTDHPLELRMPNLETFKLSTPIFSSTAANTWEFLHLLQAYVNKRHTMPEVVIDDVVSSLRLINIKLNIEATSLGKDFPYMEKEHLQIIDRLRNIHDISINILTLYGDEDDLVKTSIQYWKSLEGENR
ncbi:hypothetical protein CPB83DRAFT_849048 [Crepidotus variabilis]|uniref:F-box domain-containing protein n=1 Tax=Crepidotus variabilis TaxID=179855 RepID=A0A9P6ELR6_9AGAR|nr:hypothetical protein CPB83DRAFT_849048 [Crepidotus variabilis]